MKWVTKAHVHVDSVACPWLIRRFVDSKAEFIFTAEALVDETAKAEEAIPFAVEGAELSRQGDKSAFWAIIKAYNLTDPTLIKMSEIVNGAESGKLPAHPYASGLEAVARGFSLIFPDDHENLEQQFWVYDALYAAIKSEKIVRAPSPNTQHHH